MKIKYQNKEAELLYPIEEGREVWIWDSKDSVKLPEVKEILLYNKLGFALKFITLDDEEHKIDYL